MNNIIFYEFEFLLLSIFKQKMEASNNATIIRLGLDKYTIPKYYTYLLSEYLNDTRHECDSLMHAINSGQENLNNKSIIIYDKAKNAFTISLNKDFLCRNYHF